jgi:hypothetical protein
MDSVSNGTNRKIHVLTGVFVFLASFFMYYRTMAPTTSYWDCGEFIACSYTLSVMHPPGSPLYLLIGRIMTLLPFFKDIGVRVNIFSVFISALTVVLTYLIIVQLVRRYRGEAKNWEDRLILYFSGALGALAFAFTDSFWFNSVEAEVYAFSMFFTAVSVWLALYWEERSEKPNSLIYILLIFYLFGLALSVHLLNLLVFPFILLIAYFHKNQTVRRFLMLLSVQAAVPFALQFLLYQFNPDTMSYSAMLAHQAKAGQFLMISGLVWVAATLVYMYSKDRKVFAIWWIVPALAVFAYTSYLMIYMRAHLHPPINENDPSTWKGMLDYLNRKQYGEDSMTLTFLYRKAEFWRYQIQMMYTRYFGWQFIGRGLAMDNQDRIIQIISFKGLYGLPFLVGLWGMVHHFTKDWKRAVAVLVLFVMTGLAIIIYLNQPDPQPRERDYSYVGSFFAFALWIGIGAAALLEQIGGLLKNKLLLKKAVYAVTVLALLAAVPVNLIAYNFHSHDRSGNYVAYDYSYNILQTCEPNGIIFTNGDNDTFPLWFLQEVYGVRKDVRLVNLSLLNTSWYIKQLRDIEPKVPISLTDAQIEGIMPMQWETRTVSLPVPEWLQKELRAKMGRGAEAKVKDRITFTVKPTFKAGGDGLRVQDLMILNILDAAEWKRPIYFAVTVSSENFIGLEPYFRMDGLAFKILPYQSSDREGSVDPGILKDNLLNKYWYRGLNDAMVYYDVNTLKLLQNYRSAFLQVAQNDLSNGRKQEAAAMLDKMCEVMPESVIPYNDERTAFLISDLYNQAGRSDDAEARTRYIIPGVPRTREDAVRTAYFMGYMAHNWDKCEALLWDLMQGNATDVPFGEFLRLFTENGQYARAQKLLDLLQTRFPGDSTILNEQRKLRKLMTAVPAGGKPESKIRARAAK